MKKAIYLLLLMSFFSCEKKTTSSGKNCSSTQCTATASSTGNRCQNMTTNCAGLCYVHD